MQKRLLFFVFIFLYAGGAWAQQSFFNAFSGDRTEKNKHFYQGQANFTQNHRSVLNNTYDYGLTDIFEVGLNWFDLPIVNESAHNDQEFLVNGQVFYEINSLVQISAGGQWGGVKKEDSIKWADLFYLNSQWRDPYLHSKAVVGVVYSNDNFLNTNNVIFQLGLEIPLIYKKLHFVTDYLSRRSENSVGVIGGVYYFFPDWALSLGYQYPAPQSANHYGAVMELTYSQN